jgi:predicted neutral ceramidase superfamily lipid hydrolase
MKVSQKIKYFIYFLATLALVTLGLLKLDTSNQFMIVFLGAAGVLVTVYYTGKLKGNPTLRRHQYRVAATLSLIIIFLSATIFIYYPTVFGVTAFIVVYILLLGGFKFIEWYEKKKTEWFMTNSKR